MVIYSHQASSFHKFTRPTPETDKTLIHRDKLLIITSILGSNYVNYLRQVGCDPLISLDDDVKSRRGVWDLPCLSNLCWQWGRQRASCRSAAASICWGVTSCRTDTSRSSIPQSSCGVPASSLHPCRPAPSCVPHSGLPARWAADVAGGRWLRYSSPPSHWVPSLPNLTRFWCQSVTPSLITAVMMALRIPGVFAHSTFM